MTDFFDNGFSMFESVEFITSVYCICMFALQKIDVLGIAK